jgi:polar amino acid transport system substrate-binding protein
MHDYFVQTGLQVIPVPAQTVAAALKLLASGKYDYAVLATLPGTYLISERGIDNVDLVSKGIDTKKYCYAVKDGNKAVLAKFSEGLAILKQTGRYRELQDKWLADAESEIGPWPWLARHRLVIVASLVLVLAASIVWSASLTRQVAIRTAALEHEVEERKRAAEELRRNQVALEHEVEERKRAAEELKLQQQQLIQADKMAALGVLVSGMAHEINNPNGLILLNLPAVSEVIRDSGPILEEYHRTHGDFTMGGLPYSKMRNEVPFMVEEMQDAAKRIKRIVDDLKHFSRRSDASFDELVDLNKVVQTSLRLVDNPLRKATNHYNAHYVEPLPKVKGNFQRLEQVIVNLILNARQALESPDKGILVSTMYDRTTGNVIVKVNDEGVGIPPEHLPRLTDPFFTTKRETGGTGLGLSISAGIIREHGGTIRFESQPGKGTTVIVTLPVASEDIS